MRARPSASKCVSVGQAQQPARRRGDIGLAHQRLADQEAARTRGGEAVEVGGVANPAFGDDDAVRRHLRRQPLGGAEIDLQRLQIAVVDADQPRVERAARGRARPDRAPRPARRGRVRLPPPPARAPSASESAAMISRTQSAPMRAAFDDLVGVEDEVLAQHRQAGRGARRHQMLVAALEIGHVGQHREAGRTARLIGAGEGRRDRNRRGSARRSAMPS